MDIVEFVIAGLLFVGGLFSLLKWLDRHFEAGSLGQHVAYALHMTARVGMWFAFAGFFAGYALVEDPQGFRWYILIPIGLAGLRLLTGLYLARPPVGGLDDSSR